MSRKNRRRAPLLLTFSSTATETAPEQTETVTQYWSGVIGAEGVLTGDGRLIDQGALEWSTPIPLRFVKEDVGAHLGAVVVGRILTIERGEDGLINASGDFDLSSPEGREAARLVTSEMLRGVSMDLDSTTFEVRVSKELLEAQQDMFDALFGEGDEGEEAEEPEVEEDEEGRVIVHRASADDEVMAITSARIRAATLVSVPAFAEAMIAPAEVPSVDAELAALVASAAPVAPPQEWFETPEADGPTALTITAEGRVYGHLATWDTCHVASPSGEGVCVMAPKSPSNYSYFHTGGVMTAEGSVVPTGVVRFNTGHASLRANASDAAAHYDNTGLAGADVHTVDGKYGVWVAGALRPGLTEEQVRTLRASPLSGDWRYINGQLELVGALAVNLPGFPIPRTQGLVASGEIQGLVAAGMIAPERAVEERTVGTTLSSSDAAYLQRLIEREKNRDRDALRARVEAAKGRRKVEQLAAQRRIERLATSVTESK